MRTLNLGILAHVDAGKTSLTERLLYEAGVLDRLGSVDAGSTVTDSMDLERRRGITIRAAVVSFEIGSITVNLIDTPGHPDFIAEVERVLGVLDGAVLVVSAVEGVQPQTRILMRTLRRLQIPTIVFVNKIDRAGARGEEALDEVAEKLVVDAVPLGWPEGLGTRGATFRSFAAGPVERTELAELAARTRAGRAVPVLFGSAITGAGLPELRAALTALLPAGEPDPEGPPTGAVFKIERGPAGERLAYVRMVTGTLRVRDAVPAGPAGTARERRKVTGIGRFERGAVLPASALPAGRIGVVRGLGEARIGDLIGEGELASSAIGFPPPTVEAVVTADRTGDGPALHAALEQLAEQDPLIGYRRDDDGRTLVSLYGEVQKEVIQETLAQNYGLAVTFRGTSPICVEQLVGTGAAVEVIDQGENPFLATVGLRVEPGLVGAGVSFGLEVEPGCMPAAFFVAVQESARAALRRGNHGWAVPDCALTLTHAGYWARQSHAHAVFDKSMSSTAGDFRQLTPVVLRAALERAGTRVLEPIQRFRLEAPTGTLAALLPLLGRHRAVPLDQRVAGPSTVLEGDMPAAEVHPLALGLAAATHGEGVLEAAFDHYRPVR